MDNGWLPFVAWITKFSCSSNWKWVGRQTNKCFENIRSSTLNSSSIVCWQYPPSLTNKICIGNLGAATFRFSLIVKDTWTEVLNLTLISVTWLKKALSRFCKRFCRRFLRQSHQPPCHLFPSIVDIICSRTKARFLFWKKKFCAGNFKCQVQHVLIPLHITVSRLDTKNFSFAFSVADGKSKVKVQRYSRSLEEDQEILWDGCFFNSCLLI